MKKRFVVINNGYPLEVHRAGCADLRGQDQAWVITGNTVQEAVQAEADELNSQFDYSYKLSDLFRVMPCAGRKQ